MITIPAGARILSATRPIDFRKGGHSLAALAQEVLAEDRRFEAFPYRTAPKGPPSFLARHDARASS